MFSDLKRVADALEIIAREMVAYRENQEKAKERHERLAEESRALTQSFIGQITNLLPGGDKNGG